MSEKTNNHNTLQESEIGECGWALSQNSPCAFLALADTESKMVLESSAEFFPFFIAWVRWR